MTKLDIFEIFEELHEREVECDECCSDCEYLEICDAVEQLLERKKKKTNGGKRHEIHTNTKDQY